MYKWILDKTDTVWELLILYLLVIIAASVGFTFTEDISFLNAVWLSFVTATSVGYGDFYPKHEIGRVIAVLLMHSTLFFIIPLVVVRLMQSVVKDTNAFTHEEQEEIKKKLDAILRNRFEDLCVEPGQCPNCSVDWHK